MPQQPWWRQPFSMFQTNLREIDAGIDVEQNADFIQSYGADAWLISIGGIISNYPSRLPFQSPNPHLSQRPSGDLIGDACKAAAKRGIKIMGRMDFSKVTAQMAARNPQWCYVSPQGEHLNYNGLVTVCPSSIYAQQHAFDVLDEVLENYPVEGFFFNVFGYLEADYSSTYHGPCHCEACAEQFQQLTGLTEIPNSPEHANYDAWQGFAATKITELTGRFQAHLASKAHGIPLISGDRADIYFYEANNALQRELWPFATSQTVSAARRADPQRPALVNAVAFFDMPYRMASENSEQFAHYLIQAIARGGLPSTYIMGTPVQENYPCLAESAKVVQFYRQHAPLYRGLQPRAQVVLVRPCGLRLGHAKIGEATQEFRGLYRILVENHVPFDVLDEDKLTTPQVLAGARAVILPDLGTPDEPTLEVLTSFAGRGGSVVATGSSLLTAPDDDAPRAHLGLFGRLIETAEGLERLKFTYVGQAGTPGQAEAPVYGASFRIDPAPEVRSEGAFYDQAPYGPPEKCYGHVPDPQWPTFLSRAWGLGQFVALPWAMGRTYYETELSSVAAQFLPRLLHGELADLQVATNLPPQVEVVLGQGEGGQLIHLINYSGAGRRNIGPHVEVAGGYLEVPVASSGPGAGGVQVSALVAGRQLRVVIAGGVARVELPKIAAFEVLQIVADSPAP